MKKQQTLKQINAIKKKVEAAIEFINAHEIYIRQTPVYWEMVQNEKQAKGFSLVKTTNLADFYKIQEFCNSTGMELVNDSFGY